MMWLFCRLFGLTTERPSWLAKVEADRPTFSYGDGVETEVTLEQTASVEPASNVIDIRTLLYRSQDRERQLKLRRLERAGCNVAMLRMAA